MKKPSTADFKHELVTLLLEHQEKASKDFYNGDIDEMAYLQRSIPVGMHEMIDQAIENAWSKVIP